MAIVCCFNIDRLVAGAELLNQSDLRRGNVDRGHWRHDRDNNIGLLAAVPESLAQLALFNSLDCDPALKRRREKANHICPGVMIGKASLTKYKMECAATGGAAVLIPCHW